MSMKIIADILATGNFTSSSTKTPQFLTFVKHFKRCFKREMATIGVLDLTFSVGHFYVSGFFSKNGQTYYFSVGDVRMPQKQMMFRTAKDTKDYTGGHNQWVEFGDAMAEKMRIN